MAKVLSSSDTNSTRSILQKSIANPQMKIIKIITLNKKQLALIIKNINSNFLKLKLS